MKLQDGKKYRDGMGHVVTVRRLARNGGMFPFIGDNYSRYMADGSYIDKHPDYAPLRQLDLVEKASP